MNGFVFEPGASKPAQPKTIFDLSPQGQKALVKVLGTKEAKSDDFIGKLAKSLATAKKDPGNVVDYTKFTKRLVFSIRNISPFPADRIAKISIKLNVNDPHLKIISFDKIITKYESVDVGKLDFSNTTNLGISGNAGAGAGSATDTSTTATIPTQPGFGYGINANVSNSRTFAEEVMLKQRYVSLSGYVTPNSVNLYEESTSGVDLSGNIIADITVQYKQNDASKVAYKFSNLIKSNVFTKPDSLEIAEEYIFYPNLTDDISLSYEYESTIRHVNKGDKTISESDDDVVLNSGEARPTDLITLIPKDEFIPKIWGIYDEAGVLNIRSPIAQPSGLLFFDSFDDAKQFLFWLRKSKDIIGTGKLGHDQYQLLLSDGKPVTVDFINKCYIRIFK